jgi:hypothetical protein
LNVTDGIVFVDSNGFEPPLTYSNSLIRQLLLSKVYELSELKSPSNPMI